MLIAILTGLWIAACLALWFWQSLRFRRLKSILLGPEPRKLNELQPGISLIICFKDEEENLAQNLEFWCKQDYPNFEIILVDDHSSDGSNDFIREQQLIENHKIKLISPQANSKPGKKEALKRGILAATNDYLVFTDADCIPQSRNWLRAIGSRLNNNDVVLGYGALNGHGFTASLSDFETVQTVLRYWSYAEIGQAYMGVGRNLAYRKSSMRAVQALAKHQDLLSGDDDLTLREMGRNLRVACLTSADTFTVSPSPTNLKSWWKQKGRHYSTAWRYDPSIRFSLGVEGVLQLGFALLLPFAIIGLPYYYLLALFFGRWFFSGYPRKAQTHLIQQKGQAWLWPFYEMFWAIATTLLHLRNLIWGPPKKW